MRFRTLLFLAVIPVVLVSILVVAGLLILQVQVNTERQEHRVLSLLVENLEKEFQTRMDALANLQFQDNPFYVNRVLADLDKKYSKGFAQVLVFDRQGRILLPVAPVQFSLPAASRLRSLFDDLPPDESRAFQVRDPFFPEPNHDYTGMVRFNLTHQVYLLCYDDLAEVDGPVQVALESTLVLGSLVLILIAFGLYWLSGFIARPLQTLSEGVRAFAGGQLDRRFSLKASREIVAIGQDFNLMADRIHEFTNNLEQKVQDRTRALAETRNQLVQMEKLASLGSLVSGFAHELNTPLGNALTALTLAEDLMETVSGPSASTVREGLDLCRQSLRRAIQMMNRFRELSADQRNAEVREFRLDEFVTEFVAQMASLRTRSRITLVARAPEALSLRSKPAILEQIFEELIDNTAYHATRDGTGILVVELSRAVQAVVLTIGDEGPGIPPDLRATVFDPFVIGHRTEGRVGLGLNIVFNLVTRQLGGQIELLDRQPGAWFRITIPSV